MTARVAPTQMSPPSAPEPSRPAARTLRVDGVVVEFAGVRAVDGVDLELAAGEVLGLIGPNGAGKTTLMNAISGYVPVAAGRVRLDDRDVLGVGPDRLVGQGIARTFQAVRLFEHMTVLENVTVAVLSAERSSRRARRRSEDLLLRLGLADVAHLPASALPAGVQRRVGIARAIATRPAFLLLDEPAAGMNEDESASLRHAIDAIRHELGCGVLLIEHDMRLIMRLCDRLQVLESGRTLFVGAPADARRDPRVVQAYLGTGGGA